MIPAQHCAFMGVASVKHWWALAHVSMSRRADVFVVGADVTRVVPP